jgi:hypothetical protein
LAHLYFAHDWILDRERVTQLHSIFADLVAACDKLNIRLIPLGGETAEGYRYTRFLVQVPSSQTLSELASIASKWGFNDWKQVPESEVTESLFSSPQYETIAFWMKPENYDPPLGTVPDGLWAAAYRNEEIMKRSVTDADSD